MSTSSHSPQRPRLKPSLSAGLLGLAGLCFAAPLVYDGPPAGDPSAWRDLVIGSDPHDGPEHMQEGTYEGGQSGTIEDAFRNNIAFGRGDRGAGGGYDIPSGGPPSPLYGAQSFTQKMLRFEEFGHTPMPDSYAPGAPLPTPANAISTPDAQQLDDFLAQPLYPEPTWASNTADQNPWKPLIETYLGQPLPQAPAEGRPPGEGWAHQRLDEFAPAGYFQSAQTGARRNLGLRDGMQLHGWSHSGSYSEFGPGGLYHNTTGLAGFDGTNAGIDIRFHPAMPLQDPLALWTFDGTLPPKLLMQCYGNPVLFRHYNALPVDISANLGFGAHTLTTHEHNGHNPAESDGYANAFFFPGQFYDYRWPMILAGHDTINTDASDPRAGYPDGNGGIVQIRGDYRETMSTHWFHDHMLDHTAQNVFKGNAAMMNYYSAIDRGNEALDDGINLRFPSGRSLDWGNRDYDVNLLLACKAWDENGQLWYNPFQNDGMIGDHLLTNWLYHPHFDVRARRYRFRMLNGSVARYFKFALVHQIQGSGGQMPGPSGSGVSYNRVPFHLIANDGNIMEHAIPMDGSSGLPAGELPIQAIAERFDIIVDFSKFAPGDKLYLVNMLEHKGGRRPEDPISLSAILSESYKGVPTDTDSDGKPDRYEGGDPVVGRFLELRVHELPAGEVDLSMNPEDYEPGGLVMLEQPTFTQEELSSARRREFEFGRSSGTDEAPWTVKNQDGAFTADPRRITSAPEMGEVEIWTLRNNSGGWSHPVHVHFEEAKILSRNGSTPPLWERYGRKDVFRIGPEQHGGDHVVLAYRFREFAGSYVEHCHNTTHEDTAMLMRWDVEFPGQFKLMPSPLPRWSGVEYVDSFGLEHFRIGDNNVPKGQSGGSGGSGGGAGTHQPPVAEPDAAQVFAGQSIDIAVTQNDIAFGGALIVPDSVSIVTPPASGTAAVSPTGVVTFLAAASADSSLQTFTYTVMDSVGETSNAATVFVQVAGVPGGGGGNGGGNQPPLANGDFGTVLLGGSVTLDILANDQAVAPATLDETSVALVNPPTVGSVSLDGQGHLTYTAPGTAGVTSVQLGYTVADSNGLVSNVAAVTISLQDPGGNGGGGNNGGGGSGGHGHGEAPRAVYDAATVAVGGSVDILVVANDTDEDGDLDPDTVLIGQSPGQGTVEILGNGWVRYTPSVSSQSSDAFSYSVADEAGLRSNQATVGVSITGGGGSGSGSAPIANYDSALAVSGTTVVIQLLANDTDADGDLDPDSVVITQYPAHGTVTLHSDGTAHYTTFLGYDSSDTFNYTVSDQAGHVSNIATVGVTIDDGQ